jgi:hypothetical protein
VKLTVGDELGGVMNWKLLSPIGLIVFLCSLAYAQLFGFGLIDAEAQTVTANQGAPGKQGPWPVLISGGGGGSGLLGYVGQGTASSTNPWYVQPGAGTNWSCVQGAGSSTSPWYWYQASTNPSGTSSAPYWFELSDGTRAVGTAANPVRVNPTGTTSQPVNFAANTTAPYGETLCVTSTSTAIATGLAGRVNVLFQNQGPNPIYICPGQACATSGTYLGYKLIPGDTFVRSVTDAIRYWCLAVTANQLTGAATYYEELK